MSTWSRNGYLASRCSLVWVVDPGRRCITTYTSLHAPRIYREEEVVEGEDVLPGLRIDVRSVFHETP